MVRFEPNWPRRQLQGHFIWFLLWLVVTAASLWLTPNPSGHGTHTELGLPPCPSVALFGLLCPGCGLTTSFAALTHGQIGLAFEAHPFGPILYALFTLTAIACLFGWWKGRRFDTQSRAANLAIAMLVFAFFGYGAWRAWRYPLHDQPITQRMGLRALQRATAGAAESAPNDGRLRGEPAASP